MLRKCLVAVLILGVLLVTGCSGHIHKVGNGAQGNDVEVARQWYLLHGLVMINKVDTNTMAGAATDYEIRTGQTVLDAIIASFSGGLIYPRKVIVRK